jgi:hypothetical protein
VMKKLGNTNTRMKSKALLIARIHTGRTWKHMDSNKNGKQSLMHLLFATSPSNTKDGEVQATFIVHHHCAPEAHNFRFVVIRSQCSLYNSIWFLKIPKHICKAHLFNLCWVMLFSQS